MAKDPHAIQANTVPHSLAHGCIGPHAMPPGCTSRRAAFPWQSTGENLMPRVDNKGISIHYRVEGNGPPLVLQHGFSLSSDFWYETGFVAALKPKYRLVLIDVRGHG